ncbi:DeoR/GlpR family DNA-binding transcription regulator [Mesorhizobium sp. B4-1-4]|uniref:DeoR/GlpR family DNA-binding transcription regulator n=1 Tax=Mesorhizobium sp. B4-1-4 TaxID=2589888 RepID=UPI00112C4A49|nr:DeoR/GlpR family DNA-binding transcription regulator [Mesorhizobium sp. B4-1-4]UCI31697.1 DeoR/GlpR family DNA-binding transcription regulator [Mesorhizobium sp. B4-1-4]
MQDDRITSLAERGASRLGAARHKSILAMIARGEILAVGELASRFGVSQETIRRDIRALEDAGMLKRIHGGAAPAGAVDLTARKPVTERLSVDRDAKALAATAALPLFEEGMNVFLGGSSTMSLLADELARRGPAMTVTTNMIDIATTLSASGRFVVTLLGGVVNPMTHTLIGTDTIRALEKRVFDLGACGASAIDPRHGFLGPTEWHGALSATLAERCQRLAFVADASKFGRVDAHIVQPFDKVDVLATDQEPTEDMVSLLEGYGVVVLLPPGAKARDFDNQKALR